MKNRFLKAKHWQLFLLTFGITFIFQLVMMGSIISNFTTQSNPDPTIIINYMKFFPVVMILYMAILFGWFWSVAIGLQKKLPENVMMKVKKFKIFFFIPLVYILMFMVFFSVFINELFSGNPEPNVGIIGVLFVVIFPLHLFSMFCIFYSLYFVAKTFKTVELQRDVKFGEFVGEFFMIWFYPIGVWIVQPKINKMIEE